MGILFIVLSALRTCAWYAFWPIAVYTFSLAVHPAAISFSEILWLAIAYWLALTVLAVLVEWSVLRATRQYGRYLVTLLRSRPIVRVFEYAMVGPQKALLYAREAGTAMEISTFERRIAERASR